MRSEGISSRLSSIFARCLSALRSAFAAHECVLYLDGHPENKKALEYHRRAVEALNGYTAEYERLYGALTANAQTENAGWGWVRSPWPWQNTEE